MRCGSFLSLSFVVPSCFVCFSLFFRCFFVVFSLFFVVFVSVVGLFFGSFVVFSGGSIFGSFVGFIVGSVVVFFVGSFVVSVVGSFVVYFVVFFVGSFVVFYCSFVFRCSVAFCVVGSLVSLFDLAEFSMRSCPGFSSVVVFCGRLSFVVCDQNALCIFASDFNGLDELVCGLSVISNCGARLWWCAVTWVCVWGDVIILLVSVFDSLVGSRV